MIVRPWFAYVVGGVLALIAIGGLGAARRAAANPLPQTLSHAQFVSAADGTCYRAATEFFPTRLDRPYTTSLRKNLPVFERMRASLSGLVPPQNDAASFQRMLTSFDRSLQADRDLIRFYRADLPRFEEASRRQEAAWGRLRTLSGKLRLGWCRWVWTWHPQKPSP